MRGAHPTIFGQFGGISGMKDIYCQIGISPGVNVISLRIADIKPCRGYMRPDMTYRYRLTMPE